MSGHKQKRLQRQQRKSNSIKGLLIGVVLIPILIITMIMVLEEVYSAQGDYRRTLWSRISGAPAPPQGRAEVSLQVAQEICRQETGRRLGDDLIRATLDTRSSRYSEEFQVHTVFLDLAIAGRERDTVYVRCDVSAVQRIILEFRLQGYNAGFFG